MGINLSYYSKFVKGITSPASSSTEEWIAQIRKLDQSCNAALLMTSGVGMSDEAGEFAGIVKKLNFHGKDFTDETAVHLKKELGDVIFYWIMACQALDLDPMDVVETNINKLSARYPGGFDAFRSDNKPDDDV
jgi:NTP pyrophosphatase (non-canonical NTP hydrolase)